MTRSSHVTYHVRLGNNSFDLLDVLKDALYWNRSPKSLYEPVVTKETNLLIMKTERRWIPFTLGQKGVKTWKS